MKVLLINIDSKIPNLALAKIEKYHRDNGDEIFYDMPLLAKNMDKIYASVIFKENYKKALFWVNYTNAMVGGSGDVFNPANKLPDEIEKVKPRINLGFTTRGCIRKCPFCIVTAKEGGIKIVGDLLDIWDGKSREIKVLDNNILALPQHFKLICKQAREHKIKIDFNQGLDIRLVNDEIVQELSTIRIHRIRFAWDNISDEKIVKDNISLLKKYIQPSRIFVYVLCGYNTTFDDDMYRRNEINKLGCDAYIMRYHKNSKLLNEFASWNNMFKHRNVPFEEYLKYKNNIHLLKGGN